MATWPNVNNTNLSTQEDEYILFQNGINYVQDLKTLSGAIDQGEWTSTFKYYVNDVARGGNGRRYIATQNSGPDNGGVKDPVSSTNYWYDCTDVLKGEGDSAFSDNADKLDGQHGSFYRDASNLNSGTVSNARLPNTISSNITGNAATADNADDSDKLDGQNGSYYRNAGNLNAGTISDARLPSSISSDITGNAATASKSADSDKLDGQHGSFYQNASNLNTGTVSDSRLPNTISSDITGNAATADNAGNAGDSDKLDGQHGNYYLSRSNHTGTQPLSTISDAGTAAATNTVDIVAETVKNQTGGKWVVHESANGVPCVFYRMPAFSYDDLQIDNCPFTGVMDLFRNSDGSIRPYHDFAVYMASEQDGDLVSVGGGVPVDRINYDEFLQQASDSGFKMFGVYERACLNWLMIANNFQPRGNTEYGRSHEIFREFAQRQDGRVPNDRDGEARTLTGTGPSTWNHDGTEFGIADLVGNQWEWCDGLKMVDGEFVVAEYCGQPESEWSKTGRFIASGHQFAMARRGDARAGQEWSEFTKEDGYEGHELLQRLCIEPIEVTRVLKGTLHYDLTGEQGAHSGGGPWYSGSKDGPAALSLHYPRSNRNGDFGGRLAKQSDS